MLGSIRWRYIVTVAGLSALSLAAWIYALTALRAMSQEADTVLPRVVRVLEAMERIADAAQTLDGLARELARTADTGAMDDIERLDAEFRVSLRQARRDIPRPFTIQEALHARRLLEQHERFVSALKELAARDMARQSRIEYYDDRLRPLVALIAADAEQLKDMARQRMDLFLDESRDESGRSQRHLLIILFVAVAATGVSIFFFDRNVLLPVRRLRKLADEIRDGNLAARADLPPLGKRPDEIGALALAISSMIEARTRAERDLASAAEALAGSSALNRAIIDSTSDCVAALDPEYRIIMHNEAFAAQFEALFGIRPGPGRNLLELLEAFPSDRARAAVLWGRALAGEPYHVTQEITGKNDSPRHFDIRFDTLRNVHGEIIGALHSARDVTPNRRMELELRESAQELERRVRERTAELAGIMESIPAIVWISRDPECRHVTGNRAAYEFFGVPGGDNLSRTPGDGPPPSHYSIYSAGKPVPDSELPMQRAGREGIALHGVDLEMRFGDGRVRHLFGNASPVRNEAGKVTGVIGAFVDITDRKGLESDLEQARDAAQHASQAKSRFLADVSHEIRTPMNAVIGMAEVLLQSPLNPEQQDYVRTMRQAAGDLLDLLNDILDLSKIEADKLTPLCADFDLGELLDTVASTFSLAAREKGLFLELRRAKAVPDRLFGDGRRLRQILINLVGNAVKFTEHGGVALHVDRLPLPKDGYEDAVGLTFMVSDTGIGIAPDALPGIFDGFTQAHDASTGKYGGTGLGLAISRQLARMLGGDIAVTSREGKGSIFTATAVFRTASPCGAPPLQAAPVRPQAGTDSETPHRGRPARVLLVEDNPVNVKVAQLHLDKMGHHATVAVNGREALDALSREPFDVVLMDLELPDMDGIEITRRIRAGEAGISRAGTPIVAMTAHIMAEARERCLAAGMDSYMSKPVNFFELEALIRRLSSHAAASAKPVFDKAVAMRRLGIDAVTLEPIFRAALEEFGEILEDLQQAAASEDTSGMRVMAHTLRSVGGTLGFDQGVAALEDVSTALKNGRPEIARQRVRDLARLFGEGLLQEKDGPQAA